MTTDQTGDGSRINSAKTDGTGSKTSVALMLGVVGLVLLAGIVALVLSGGDDETTNDVAADVTSADAAVAMVENAPVEVAGAALIGLPREGPDDAIGQVAPSLTGANFNGSPVIIENDGRPKLVAFVAHWCPHCQREIPSVKSWLDERGPVEGVDLYAVSTAVDNTRDNYPPSEWLENEGWAVPTMADSASSDAANAFGLTGFPYWVAIDADGTVLLRLSGEQPTSVLDALVAELES